MLLPLENLVGTHQSFSKTLVKWCKWWKRGFILSLSLETKSLEPSDLKDLSPGTRKRIRPTQPLLMLSSMNNKWDLLEVRDLSTYITKKSSFANLASSTTSSITLTAQWAGWISSPFKSSINYFGTLIRPAWQLKRHRSYLQAWITTDADKLGRHNNNKTWLEMGLQKHLHFFLIGRGLDPMFSFSSYWSFCNNATKLAAT